MSADSKKAASSFSLENVLGNLPDMIRERVEQLDEREKQLEEMKRLLEQSNPCLGEPSDVLRLNVGGTRIDVLRRTLTYAEESMLTSKFSGRWDDSLEKDADGNFFIDQPIELFKPMVDYLRSAACCSTPDAPAVDSPRFEDPSMNRHFIRMVKYYGMELGVFPFHLVKVNGESVVLSSHPDYSVQANDWATILLLPCDGNDQSIVRAFEVSLGNFTNAQIGWINKSNGLAISEGKGVGSVENSIALDCGRCGISTGSEETFVAIDKSTTLDDGSIIRCENKGNEWYVDGQLVASTREKDSVARIENWPTMNEIAPCFSVKGNLRVSSIELEYKHV